MIIYICLAVLAIAILFHARATWRLVNLMEYQMDRIERMEDRHNGQDH